MLRRLEEIIGCDIATADGNVGKVHDALFDRQKWAVRHLVVDTGNWLVGRQVLVSPISVRNIDLNARVVHTDLTKQQLENAPGIAADEPVSRQYESTYYEHYGWPPYWAGPMLWGYWGAPAMVSYDRPITTAEEEMRAQAEARQDENLHSFREVNGYTVEASDGAMGDIEDVIIDDETWKLSYVLVDTSKFLPGKDVLVPPESVKAIIYNGSRVEIDMTKEELKQQPEFTSLGALHEGQTEGPVMMSRPG